MICEKIHEAISAELDNELAQSELLILHAHLRDCPSCRALYDAMKQVDQTLRAIDKPSCPDFRASIMRAIKYE